MQSKDLFVNSTNVFNYLPSSTVVQKPITYPLTNTYDITFIPYHKLGSEKYLDLGLVYKMTNIPEMDKTKCNELFKEFQKLT